MAKREHHNLFTRTSLARQALRDRADELISEYLDIAAKAKDAGDYETAMKAVQWMLEHLPADEHGAKVIDVSIDKQKQIEAKPTGPSVQIGIALGGVNQPQKALPEVKVESIDGE